jgi:hypothetical protein
MVVLAGSTVSYKEPSPTSLSLSLSFRFLRHATFLSCFVGPYLVVCSRYCLVLSRDRSVSSLSVSLTLAVTSCLSLVRRACCPLTAAVSLARRARCPLAAPRLFCSLRAPPVCVFLYLLLAARVASSPLSVDPLGSSSPSAAGSPARLVPFHSSAARQVSRSSMLREITLQFCQLLNGDI